MLVRRPAAVAAAAAEIRFGGASGELSLSCLPEGEARHRKGYAQPGLIFHINIVVIC